MARALRRMAAVGLTVLMAMMSAGAKLRAAEPVTIDAPGVRLSTHLLRPDGRGPHPAVVALHGCGGLYRRDGRTFSSRHKDWADRLLAAGFVTLFPDSFTPRGLREICSLDKRPVSARDRADDTKAALGWLAAQSFVDRSRIYLLGWSHGGSTVLWTLSPGFLGDGPLPKAAIAFYPGCRDQLRRDDWRPSVPLTMLMGAADDWTDPAPCKDLADRTGFRFVSYPGAYHGFDTPNSAVHLRRGLGRIPGGAAHVGTDPAARAAAISEVMAILAAP